MSSLKLPKSLFLLAVMTAVYQPAKADTWGCEVLLCLSNPAGPMAVSQCVPPIRKLYAAIFKLRPDPFPTCLMAVSPDGSKSYAAVERNNYYDECPAGTSALSAGSWAITNPSATQPRPAPALGIGNGAGLYPSEDQPLGQKICVGSVIGQTTVQMGSSDEGYSYIAVPIYNRITYIDPSPSGFAIKVYVNNGLFRTVRPF